MDQSRSLRGCLQLFFAIRSHIRRSPRGRCRRHRRCRCSLRCRCSRRWRQQRAFSPCCCFHFSTMYIHESELSRPSLAPVSHSHELQRLALRTLEATFLSFWLTKLGMNRGWKLHHSDVGSDLGCQLLSNLEAVCSRVLHERWLMAL